MSYCTIEDLRAEGFSKEHFDDSQLERLISTSCDFIDMITGQLFELRTKAIRVDGRGVRNLILPIFLFEIYSVNAGGEEIDDCVIYNRMEDRAYSKIFRCAGWPKGRLNIEIFGQWGYVEEDGFTPSAIKRVAMKLALYHFPALTDSDALEENDIRDLLTSEQQTDTAICCRAVP